MDKVLKIFPGEAKLVREIARTPGLGVLSAFVGAIEPEDSKSWRPIRIRLPRELHAALKQVAVDTGQRLIDLLLVAARAYRAGYPFPADAAPPPIPEATHNTDLQRKALTIKLPSEDRELIRTLAWGREETPDRHTALKALVPVLRRLHREGKIEHAEDRVAVKVTIPEDLAKSLRDTIPKGKHTWAIVEAARMYRKLNKSKTGKNDKMQDA